MRVLRDPDRRPVPSEPLVELGAEALEIGQADARPADGRVRRDLRPRRIWMLRPGVEADHGLCLGQQAREACGRVAVLHAAVPRGVVAARRGLADRDECFGVAELDTVVDRAGHRRIQGRPDRCSLLVELRREELLEVGLVPRREQTHGGIAGVASRIPVSEGRGEVLEGGRIVRRAIRRLAAVRPPRRAPDRDEELHPSLLRAANEVVDVVELIRRIERIGRVRGPVRCRIPPHDDRSENRRARVPRAVEHLRPVGSPAEARVVLEPDEQAARHLVLG